MQGNLLGTKLQYSRSTLRCLHLPLFFSLLKLQHFIHFSPKCSLTSEVKKKTMGFWRLQRAAVIIQRDGWCFVHNFSSFLTAIWALPHVQVSSLCPKPLFFYLLTHLMRKTSFSVTSGMAQISVPGPDLCTLSLGSPGRTKATSILTSTTPLTVVELLQFLRSLNKHIKAG